MRVFIINLEHSIDRRVSLQKRCDELNLEVEFIKAVEGRKLTSEEIKKMTRPLNYAFLPGEIGCALSHQLVYKKMVKENIPAALILEDDVALPDCLPELINSLPESSNKPEVLLLSRVNKFFKKPIQPLKKPFNIHRTQNATTAHSYIVNLPAAKRLLADLYPIWMTADKWSLFEDYSILKVNAIIPAPVELSPEASISTINQKKGDSDIDTKKRLIWNTLMKTRPLKAKIKHKIRRGLTPLFYSIIDQGKGPS